MTTRARSSATSVNVWVSPAGTKITLPGPTSAVPVSGLQRGPAGADHVDLVLGVRGLVVQAADRDAVRAQAQVVAAQVDDPVVGLGAVGRGVGAGFRDDPHVSSVSGG